MRRERRTRIRGWVGSIEAIAQDLLDMYGVVLTDATIHELYMAAAVADDIAI
jgi:hypothetical protein